MNIIKTKKQMFLVIGAFALVLFWGTVTYAFFSYTREGSNNLAQTGRISFTSQESPRINLSDAFPISSSNINNDTDNVGSVTIHVTGDTTYDDGV